MPATPGLFIGTAGWSVPALVAPHFPREGSHLERYASRLSCVEINSSFYRSHRPGTYARWAASTPQDFRFAVKMPRSITHECRLQGCAALLAAFLSETDALGSKKGPILIQLPPSLAFDSRVASRFFDTLRHREAGPLVCEPRHESWFTAAADATLMTFAVARVAADPAPAQGAGHPGGWPGLFYFRLHGSPHMYWSSYDDGYLDALARTLRRASTNAATWCIFDNTALGAALDNALKVFGSLTD